mgnify:CR=1 FL=1
MDRHRVGPETLRAPPGQLGSASVTCSTHRSPLLLDHIREQQAYTNIRAAAPSASAPSACATAQAAAWSTSSSSISSRLSGSRSMRARAATLAAFKSDVATLARASAVDVVVDAAPPAGCGQKLVDEKFAVYVDLKGLVDVLSLIHISEPTRPY